MHRNLKPANIFLDENGDIKLAHFGHARDIKPNTSKMVGGLLYSPPERVISSTTYLFNFDVWAVGLILYEMLTGKQFF